MFVCAVIETCCYHFNGIHGVGTKAEMDEVANAINPYLPDGYDARVYEVKAFNPQDWEF